MFSGAPRRPFRRPSAHNQFAVSSRLRIKGVFGKEGGIRLPHRSEQSGSGVPSTSTGQSQLWKLQKCNRGNRGGVDSASFGNCICAIGVVGMGPTCAEARNPGQSAAQSPSSPSAGGSGAAPDRDARRRRWARAITRAKMRSPRRIVSRCSAECAGGPRFAVARRLVNGLCANSFTSLRFAATHRIAVLAKECAQSKRGIRPPIPHFPYQPCMACRNQQHRRPL